MPLLRLGGMPPALVQGFMVVGCMPPPVSTSVILTKACAGNEASAVVNSALGSFLGVLVTPLELLLAVDPGAGGGADNKLALLGDIFGELSATVVAPIALGQLLRPRVAEVSRAPSPSPSPSTRRRGNDFPLPLFMCLQIGRAHV